MLTTRLTRILPWILGAIGAAFVGLTTSGSDRVGLTFDELGHIVSGYSYWKFDDFRVNAENGVLATRLCALPLLPMGLRFSPGESPESPSWRQVNARVLGYSFFYQSGNDAGRILAWARLGPGMAALLLLALIWRWSRGLFGPAAGLLALLLAAFSPTVLAHAGLATSDMILSSCLLAALSAWWWLWHQVTVPRLLLTALATGFAITAKMSGILLAPMLVALFVVRCAQPAPLLVALGAWRKRIRSRRLTALVLAVASATVVSGSYGVIWTAYGFRFSSHPPGSDALSFEKSWSEVLSTAPENFEARGPLDEVSAPPPSTLTHRLVTNTIAWARDRELLPEAFLWGLAYTFKSSRGREAFLMGRYSSTGWPEFFPLAFLLKSTPPELLLFAGGILSLVLGIRAQNSVQQTAGVRRAIRRRWLYRGAPLFILFFVYWTVAINTPLNIGHRHLLPIYPVVFIVGGAAVMWVTSRRNLVFASILALLVGGQIVGAIRARPFYLSYFTPFVGGQTQGWHYLVDSSFDWGQGLPDFIAWLEARKRANDTTPVFLSYFGSDSPRARQLPVTRFGDWRDDNGPRRFPARVSGGWFAISATHFRRIYLGLPGPWSAEYERAYLEHDRALRLDPSAAAALTPERRAQMRPLMMAYEVLQFGRLCHFLQNREPDAVIGASLLIFRLTDAEVSLALNAPLAEVNTYLKQAGNHR